MRGRVSACTRWNAGAVEARRLSTDYLCLDQFRHDEQTQEELYATAVQPFVERCLQGCCGSVITYGAWGSGKSYTLGTLDPQHLTLTGLQNDSAGVLPRCIRQLYEQLGPEAALEITCVEIQGDDVTDLLDPRVCPPIGRLSSAGPVASSSPTLSPGSHLASGGSSPGGPSPGPGPTMRSPVGPSAARKKPPTLVVARSLPEALLSLKRAVSNRQAFVTASRHSSSRTHAVIQLRWRTAQPGQGRPSPPQPPLHAVTTSVTCSRVPLLRPFSAPPRPGTMMPTAGPRATAAAAGGGPVCALTLVDTCSFCPLMSPKEGSAVKRSLLALSRLLLALQRRQALSLRESKLTRMLEGAVDQVLVLACLGGSGDEASVQLVKMLQQGAQRESGVRRSRRASSSDSPRMSSAWEAASRSSLCSVSARSLGTPKPEQQSSAAAGGADQQRKQLSSRQRTLSSLNAAGEAAGAQVLQVRRSLTRGPSSIFYSPTASPAPTGSRRDAEGSSRSTRQGVGAGAGLSSRGAVSFPVDCNEEDGDDEGEGEDSGRDVGRGTVPLPPMAAPALATDKTSVADISRRAACSSPAVRPAFSRAVDLVGLNPMRAVSPGMGLGGRGRTASVTASGGVDMAGGRAAAGTLSTGKMSPREKQPPAVAARASPGAEFRKSQGFSVLSGKWAPPPPLPSASSAKRRDTFPVLPQVLSPRDDQTGSGHHRCPPAAVRTITPPTAPPAPPARTPPASGSYAASHAAAARKRTPSGIPARPPARAPQSSSGSAVVPAQPVTAYRPASRASPRSPSPAGAARVGAAGAPLVSLTAVRPTRLASSRYGGANLSQDSAPDGSAAGLFGATAAATGATATTPKAALVTSPTGVRASRRRLHGGEGVAQQGQEAPLRAPAVTALMRRSISSGTRWPSPLLRARRAEWLAEERRSRSAFPRRELEPTADGATPRGRGWRCAPLGRPTLSSQYKDLLMDFEAFKAKERKPRRRVVAAAEAAAEGQKPQPHAQAAAASPAPAEPQPLRTPRTATTHEPQRPDSPAAVPPPCDPSSAPGQPQPLLPHPTPLVSNYTPPGLAVTAAAAPAAAAPSLPLTAVSHAPAVSRASPTTANPKPPYTRQHSPPTDEGLMSLTAAAAVAAASPRAPPCGGGGGGVSGGRSRPGVTRGTGMHPSPRHRCSPDTVIPTVVLDMSRLSASAAVVQAPGSARGSRLAVAAVAGGGGVGGFLSARERGTDGVRAGDAGKRRLGRGTGDSASSSDHTSSDSERGNGNILGPSSLMDLNRMLHVDAALRQSTALAAAAGGKEGGGGGGAAAGAAQPALMTPRQRAAAALAAALSQPQEVVASTAAASHDPAVAPLVAMATIAGAEAMPVAKHEESEGAALTIGGAIEVTSAQAAAQPPAASAPAAAPGAAAQGSTCGRLECHASADFELPAVSFFIHQFGQGQDALGPEWGSGARSQEGTAASAAASSEAMAVAALAATAALQPPVTGASPAEQPSVRSVAEPRSPSGVQEPSPLLATEGRPLQGRPVEAEGAGREGARPRRMDLVAAWPTPYSLMGGSCKTEGVPEGGRVEERQRPDEAVTLLGAGTASLLVPDRFSVESAGVLRGSCTPFAVDSGTPSASLDPTPSMPQPQPQPRTSPSLSPPQAPNQSPRWVQQGSHCTHGEEGAGDALHPLQDGRVQQQPHEQQQRTPMAPEFPSQAAAETTPRSLVMPLAHVPPNHSDLDEQSNVLLVGADSGSESEREADEQRDQGADAAAEAGGDGDGGVPCLVVADAVDAATAGSPHTRKRPAGEAAPAMVKSPRTEGNELPESFLEPLPVVPQPSSPPPLMMLTDSIQPGTERECLAGVLQAPLQSPVRDEALASGVGSSTTGAAQSELLSPRTRQSWSSEAQALTATASPNASGGGASSGSPNGSHGGSRIPALPLRSSPSAVAAVCDSVSSPRNSPRNSQEATARRSSGGGHTAAAAAAHSFIPTAGRSPRPGGAASGKSPLGTSGRSATAGRASPLQAAASASPRTDQSKAQQVVAAAPVPSPRSGRRSALPGPSPAVARTSLDVAPLPLAGRSTAATVAAPSAGRSPGRPARPEPAQPAHPAAIASSSAQAAQVLAPKTTAAATASPSRAAVRSPECPLRLSAASTLTSSSASSSRLPTANSPSAAPNRTAALSPDRSPRRLVGGTPPDRSAGQGSGRGRSGPALGLPSSQVPLDSSRSSLAAMLSPQRIPGARNAGGGNVTTPSRSRSPRRTFGLSPGRLWGQASSRDKLQQRSADRPHEAAAFPASASAEGAPGGGEHNTCQGGQQQPQQHHSQQLQQSLRNSGNVAASWRAAAAIMSTSSSSSVRSCFRSTVPVGQQQQQQMAGGDATATATVVGRLPTSCTAAAAAALPSSGTSDKAPSGVSASVDRLEQSHGLPPAQQPQLQSAMPPLPAGMPVPPLPLMAITQRAIGCSPASAPTTARQADGAGGQDPLAATMPSGTKSARHERGPLLSARLLRGGSKGSGAQKAAVGGCVGEGGSAEEAEVPPPAYPPGFVSWAARLFSSVKGKCAC